MKKISMFRKLAICALCLGLVSSCDSGGDGGGGEPKTVLVIGDSISGKTNYPGVPPWPSLLAGMLPEWTIINRATPGERMGGGAGKVGGLLAEYNPDILVVFYGSNDAIHQDTDNYEAQLASTIQAGKAAGAKVLACTPPYMYGGRSIYNGGIDVCVAGVRSASSTNGAGVVNINGEFGMNSEDRFPDGLHPDLDGQRIIAVSVREKL